MDDDTHPRIHTDTQTHSHTYEDAHAQTDRQMDKQHLCEVNTLSNCRACLAWTQHVQSLKAIGIKESSKIKMPCQTIRLAPAAAAAAEQRRDNCHCYSSYTPTPGPHGQVWASHPHQLTADLWHSTGSGMLCIQ